ncbi:MAG TPA: cupredoxin domain-containing protein [Actinomycetota bacterium]|nr:cupredoxin domain-containing protein [Actinomycetota bacterium]
MTVGEQQRAGITWRHLLTYAALADLVVMAVVGIAVRDKEALAFAGAILIGILFLRIRSGLAGVVMLGVLSLDAAVFMLPAAASNSAHQGGFVDLLIPLSLGIISIAGLLAAIGSIFRHKRPEASRREAPVVLQTIAAVFIVALIAGTISQRTSKAEVARAGDVRVEMRNTAFLEKTLSAQSGSISVAVANHDLFWHTFTIDALHVNVDVPIGANRRVTFDAPPGTYEFYCRVPGHRAAGMKGTLIVS